MPLSVTLIALCLAAVSLAVIAFTLPAVRRTEWLLATYFVSLCFSGVDNQALGSAFELVRFGCVALLAVEGFRRPATVGPAVASLAVGAALITLMLPRSVEPLTSIPFAVGMLIVTIPLPWALRKIVGDDTRRLAVLRMFAYSSVVYVILAVIGLGAWRGDARFAGAGDAAPVFSITGAFFGLALLWGLVFGTGRFRIFSGVMFAPVIAFMVLAGQRSGTIGAAVGALPFALLAIRRVPRRVVPALLAAGALTYYVTEGEVFQYALGRLGSFDDNTRSVRWQEGIRLVMQEPLLGHGPGTAGSTGFGVHNAFLAAAYEGGLVVGFLWILGVLLALWTAVRLVRRQIVSDGTDLLFLAWIATAMVTALVESKLYSPTNIAIFTFMFSATACHHLLQRRRSGTRSPILVYEPAISRSDN